MILFASLKTLATIYTDSLWFSSVGYPQGVVHPPGHQSRALRVLRPVFFLVLLVNLVICDRLAANAPPLEVEDELVLRYQQVVRPYSGRVRVAVWFVLALFAASGTVGQWSSWILFTHGVPFGVKDPQFHMDVGFYVSVSRSSPSW